jgi:hypothetical protein
MHPDAVVSIFPNFWPVQPNTTDVQRYRAGETTADENTYLERIQLYLLYRSGYRVEQTTLPLQLAYATTDSPLGFAMWIYTLMESVVDPSLTQWTPKEIITWSLMYIIQGPYGGYRMYKEFVKDGAFSLGTFDQIAGLAEGTPYVQQPCAYTVRPYDVDYGLPLEWAQREGNVLKRYSHPQGGHFAAWETPESLAEDIRDWFADERSGTSIFSRR